MQRRRKARKERQKDPRFQPLPPRSPTRTGGVLTPVELAKLREEEDSDDTDYSIDHDKCGVDVEEGYTGTSVAALGSPLSCAPAFHSS